MCGEDYESSYIYCEDKPFDCTKFEQSKCSLCDQLSLEPIQRERGDVKNGQCYKEAYKEDEIICPTNNEPSGGTTYEEQPKDEDFLALVCWCSPADFGCPWKCKVLNVEEQEDYCDCKSEKCQFYEEKMQLSDLRIHLKDYPEMKFQDCPSPGCEYGGMSTSAKDLKKYVIYHSHLQSKPQSKIQFELDLTKQTLSKEREQHEKDMALFRKQMTEVQTDTQKQIKKQQEETFLLGNQLTQLLRENGTRNNKKQTIDISKLSSDVVHLTKQISELDIRQHLLENTSLDGKLVWRIDDIAARMRQARSGKVTALHSAPAFTHKHGYKFCARLYLNGDGFGRNTHVSLFFVLMKSEYDSILVWPFNRSVKFRLINQEREGSDMIENFDPDQKSTSFKRPVKEMNIASGCPRFISIESFTNGGFVKDDCVFLEIDVGDTDLSTKT